MRLPICIFAVAALFGRASSNVACMTQKSLDISLTHFFADTATYCQNIEERFKLAREGLETCTDHKIDIDGMEIELKEICAKVPNSGMDFQEQMWCLKKYHNTSHKTCASEMVRMYGHISRKDLPNYEVAEGICNDVAAFEVSCMRRQTANSCNGGAVAMYNRLAETVRPLLRTICLESVNVKRLRADLADIWFDDVPASATSHSAARWSIALAVSIAVVGADCLTFALSNVFGRLWNRQRAK